MKRVLTSLLFATLAGALVFGFAASLGVTSQDLGSGGGDVSSCDDSVTVSYTLNTTDPSLVDTVTVAGVDTSATGCLNDTMHVAIFDTDAHTNAPLVKTHTPIASGDTSIDFDVTGDSLTAEAVEDVVVTISD